MKRLRFTDMLAAFMHRGELPPEPFRETITEWAQMEARRISKTILALPKDERRPAIDQWPQPFREIVENEIKWLFDQRKQRAAGSASGAGSVTAARV